MRCSVFFCFQAEDGIRDLTVTGVQTCALPILEDVTGRLVRTASQEIVQGRLQLLREQSLSQAQAKDYVRQTQERLLLAPLLARLQSSVPGHVEVEPRLRSLLSEVRERALAVQGYGPANLVALLRLLRGDLRGLDLSQLALRGAYLQGVEMQDRSEEHTSELQS